MSDFWGLSTGESAAEKAETSYEVASGGGFDAFPEGTKLLAMVTDAEWRTNDQSGLENLSITRRSASRKRWRTGAYSSRCG